MYPIGKLNFKIRSCQNKKKLHVDENAWNVIALAASCENIWEIIDEKNF